MHVIQPYNEYSNTGFRHLKGCILLDKVYFILKYLGTLRLIFKLIGTLWGKLHSFFKAFCLLLQVGCQRAITGWNSGHKCWLISGQNERKIKIIIYQVRTYQKTPGQKRDLYFGFGSDTIRTFQFTSAVYRQWDNHYLNLRFFHLQLEEL